MKRFLNRVTAVILIILTFTSYTMAGFDVPTPVPEPSMLPLFVVAALAFYIANKRKK